MTRKDFSFASMFMFLGFLGLNMALGMLFPAIPWWVYLSAALAFAGFLAVFLLPRLRRRLTEAMTDERTEALAGRAAGYVYRISYAILLVFGCVAMQIGRGNAALFAAGLTALIASTGQAFLYSAIWAVLERRS